MEEKNWKLLEIFLLAILKEKVECSKVPSWGLVCLQLGQQQYFSLVKYPKKVLWINLFNRTKFFDEKIYLYYIKYIINYIKNFLFFYLIINLKMWTLFRNSYRIFLHKKNGKKGFSVSRKLFLCLWKVRYFFVKYCEATLKAYCKVGVNTLAIPGRYVVTETSQGSYTNFLVYFIFLGILTKPKLHN